MLVCTRCNRKAQSTFGLGHNCPRNDCGYALYDGAGPPLAPIKHDAVEHPKHYTSHPSGVECIQITEHMNFCLGNALKYLWRAGQKSDELKDLKKARWYIDREIARVSTASV